MLNSKYITLVKYTIHTSIFVYFNLFYNIKLGTRNGVVLADKT